MDAERWERVQRIFHEAIALPEERRREYVNRACADTPEIAAEVLALLAEDGSTASPLDDGVGSMAHAILEPRAPLPAEIGPYRIKRVLGEGGMGVVYLAEREDLDNVVAIKFLRDARLSRHRRDRFLREQRILARLSHPSICRLFDAGVLDDGSPYFVMEYVDG
ncbi:MAG: protein kinase, partial [Acidobacteriota bacterium]|nr:protein kinase [Acidobacteriota bacterium]